MDIMAGWTLYLPAINHYTSSFSIPSIADLPRHPDSDRVIVTQIRTQRCMFSYEATAHVTAKRVERNGAIMTGEA